MNATLRINEELKGIEIQFNEKPGRETLDTLKAQGFRWHNVKKVWYAKQTESRMALAQAIADGKPQTITAEAPKDARADFKALLEKEFGLIWGAGSKLTKEDANNVATIAELPDGKIVPVHKQGIKTRFCFGESGYDYDDALNMAQHARTSEEYFKQENMEHFKEWMEDLEEAKKYGNYVLVIDLKPHHRQPEECRIVEARLWRIMEVIEACGGSVNKAELPGKQIERWAHQYRVATPEEIDLIEKAYKEAAAAHEKKVDSYLKRYGTSKVYSWTYWREA